MSSNPESNRRTSVMILVRVLQLALVIAIVYFGSTIVQDGLRVLNEQNTIEGRREAYQLTATAIAPNFDVDGDSSAYPDTAQQWVSLGDLSVEQFATNTPRPVDAPPTATPEPAQPVIETTSTPVPTVPPQPLPTILFLGEPSAEEIQNAPTAIPTVFPLIPRENDLVNILLLGQDNELTGESLARTDTMIIVSINRDTNTVSMLSLPRDLLVYMPRLGMQRLNVAFGAGENLGWQGGGFFYMRQVILYNLGINVHYYAMVDLSGFAEIIDTLGGVEVAVDCAIQDYALIGADVPTEAVPTGDEGLYTLPVGYYEMTGKEALWYARSRGNSDDFDRGRRQQQILRAGFSKAKNSGFLTDLLSLPGLIQQGLDIVETDMGVQDVLGLIPNALNLDPSQIENFRFARLYHTTPWQPPDGSFVQLPNPDQVYELMLDFYTPPTQNQLSLRGARIRVLNGTGNASWDRVGAARLSWDNLEAVAAGEADRLDYGSTMIIDYTGSEKGSSVGAIAEALNVAASNVVVQPDSNRQYDFDVIIGADYNSCTGFVLPPEEVNTEG